MPLIKTILISITLLNVFLTHSNTLKDSVVWSYIDRNNLKNKALFEPVVDNFYPLAMYSYYENSNNKKPYFADLVQINLFQIIRHYTFQSKLNIYPVVYNNGDIDVSTEFESYNPRDSVLQFKIIPKMISDIENESIHKWVSDTAYYEKISRFSSLYFSLENELQIIESMKSISYPDEDSIDNYGNTLYFPQKRFVKDLDIRGYALKEIWSIDSSGQICCKKIKFIAPIIYGPVIYHSSNFKLLSHALFWVNFSEIAPILKHFYFLLGTEYPAEIISALDFFDKRLFEAKSIDNHVW